MTSNPSTDLESFQHFLQEQIAHGQADLTPEESLRLFRDQQREFEETVAGVKRGLESMERGEEGIPIEHADAVIRRKHNIPQEV